jgi:phospholipid/cholesterol/gamma-HCH transport system substrate-binding protein
MSALRRGRTRARSRKRKGPNPLAIAAATILLALAITYYAFSGKQIPFVHHFTMHALVRNSVDIIPDSPVRIAGIDVGSVTGTSAEGSLTRVDFTVGSNGQPVHTDATVTIRDRLFLEGGYYLQLDPGSPSAPVAKDGFTIPVSNTAYPVQFYQVLSTFDSATRRSLQNTLNTLNQGFSAPAGQQPTAANSGVGALKQAVPQFAPTLKDIAWVAQGLNGTHPGDMERLLASASDVTSTLRDSSAQLAGLITGLDRTSTALASSDGALAQSIAGVDQTLKAAPPALTAIDRALPPVTRLAGALDPSLKVAPPLLDGLTKAVGELAAVVAPAERARLIDTLKTTFVEFPTTLRQLGTAFPITKGVTDCLRTHVTPVLTSQVPDGALSTGRPVWQDFVHFIVGLSSAVQDFDGNGYWIRSILGTGTNSASVGKLLSSGASIPGIQGSSPHWVGDLTPSDFRPDASCSSQPVVNLSSTTSAPALSRVTSAAPQTSGVTSGIMRFLGLR